MFKKEFQIKANGRWVTTFVNTNMGSVEADLAHDLLHKYVEKAQYITRIKRVQNYTDKTITVYYSDDFGGGRAVYTLPAVF